MKTIFDKNTSKKSNFQNWMNYDKNKSLLRFLTCGSVDDGKSTLIGRLLYDTQQVYDDHLSLLKRDSKKHGTQGNQLDLALLVDGLAAEQEQGITIDVAYRYFSTDKRKFIIADTPGHEQYTRNMVTGASNCDVSILLIDARKGLLQQTYRHVFISNLLGINCLLVAVNKMDLVDYKQVVFEKIKQDFIFFTNKLNNKLKIFFIPISAIFGENIVFKSRLMKWYSGLTLLNLLETIAINSNTTHNCIRFPIQYVHHPNLDFRGYSGTLVSGVLKVGDHIKILPGNMTSTIIQILIFNKQLEQVVEKQSVTLVLKDNIDISRGDMIVNVDSTLHSETTAIIDIVWMSEKPLVLKKSYDIKLINKKTRAYIKKIFHKIDVNTLIMQSTDTLYLNDIGTVEIIFEEPVLFDCYTMNKITGSLIIIDRLNNITVAAGMIKSKSNKNNMHNINRKSSFEFELNNLICQYFPDWGTKKL